MHVKLPAGLGEVVQRSRVDGKGLWLLREQPEAGFSRLPEDLCRTR